MKHLYKQISLVCFFLLLCHNLLGQNNTELSDIFDDNNISSAKNVVALNVTSISAANIEFLFERVLTEVFSTEVGAGIMLPYAGLESIHIFDFETSRDTGDISWGYSFGLHPKVFIVNPAPFSFFVGLHYRYRYFAVDNVIRKNNDFMLTLGNEKALPNGFVIGGHFGMGYRFDKKQKNEYGEGNDPIISLCLKIGYIL